MSEYINKYFSDYLCGFRKGISSQHSLIIMIEKIRKLLDKGGYAGVLLTDLYKAFDYIVHDLLIEKRVHNKNVQIVATEIYKIKQGIAPSYTYFQNEKLDIT